MRHLLLTKEELDEYNDDPEGHVYEESIARESDSVIYRRDIRRNTPRCAPKCAEMHAEMHAEMTPR